MVLLAITFYVNAQKAFALLVLIVLAIWLRRKFRKR